jgi:hypothetical protein
LEKWVNPFVLHKICKKLSPPKSNYKNIFNEVKLYE